MQLLQWSFLSSLFRFFSFGIYIQVLLWQGKRLDTREVGGADDVDILEIVSEDNVVNVVVV